MRRLSRCHTVTPVSGVKIIINETNQEQSKQLRDRKLGLELLKLEMVYYESLLLMIRRTYFSVVNDKLILKQQNNGNSQIINWMLSEKKQQQKKNSKLNITGSLAKKFIEKNTHLFGKF